MSKAPYIRSIPIDITDEEMKKVFKGMAIYNDGTISVAYHEPMVFQNMTIRGRQLFTADARFAIAASDHFAIQVRPIVGPL